jgi:hypothetical protein
MSCAPPVTQLQLHAPAPTVLTNNMISHISNQVALPAAAIDPKNVVTVQLGDRKFSFDRTMVDDPPAKHFSEDIEGLFEHWNNSSLLVVNGHGIPIKYWPEFYQAKKGFKSGAWKAIRVEWGNWKVSLFVVSNLLLLTHRHSSLLLKNARNMPAMIFFGLSSVTQSRVHALASHRS